MIEIIQNFISNLTIEDLGFMSTICLGLCSFPLVFKTLKEGHCKEVSGLFIFTWWLGDILGIFYVIPLGKLPLILNYGGNTIMASVMLYYKIRKNK